MIITNGKIGKILRMKKKRKLMTMNESKSKTVMENCKSSNDLREIISSLSKKPQSKISSTCLYIPLLFINQH